jgi:hypothetical protein
VKGSTPPTSHVLLTRHFLRQFLENDLISPDADRSQLVAVVGSTVVCLTLFISVALSFNYVMVPFTPGQLAVLSLNDKFFYLALAMTVTALAAVAQWDGLAIGARDAAILEPLPIRAGDIRRAKLAAVAIFGAAVAAAVTIFPSIVFPWLLVYSLRQMSLVSLLWLMATHALVAAAAAAFGFLAIVAMREVLAALTGPRWFPRVSPSAQGVLIVLVGASLLLLPAAGGRIAERGFEGWQAMSPPMWFLGAHETMAGGIIADLPRTQMSPRQIERDRVNTALYASRRDAFPALASRAAVAFGVLLLVAVMAYGWNARRLPSLTPAPPRAARRRWRLAARLAHALLLRDAAARAGFHLTLAALWRSHTHRLTLACAAAAGLAMAVVALSRTGLEAGAGASARELAVQPLVYGALLVGFRHAIRVPAELRASWGFQLAWRGHERRFLSGVKRAAILALAMPTLIVLLPLFVFLLGPRLALTHAVLGLAGAIVLLEGLLVTYDKVPFTCTYVPSENMKALGPVYAIAFLVGASQFARLQHAALNGGGATLLLIALAVIFAVLRAISARRVRLPWVEFNEAPASFQRLGLDG